MSEGNNIIRTKLFSWYKDNQRVLPWRQTKDPYKIWLSEIIMQQTRVVQGTPYYLAFIEKYPTVGHLAAAGEQEVLRLWQGLGYYSRGRNLLRAAKQVVNEFGEAFPQEYEQILTLKGVGPYSAAAIASIAFDKPHAALDGNVYRVLARLYEIETPINANGARARFQKYADELLDKKRPGTFNQAMMELGATICTPRNPLCTACPINGECVAYKNGTQETLPQKLAARAVKKRHFHYLLIKNEERFYMTQRPEGDIWQGLYELPMIETSESGLLTADGAGQALGTPIAFLKPVLQMLHKLTHQHLDIAFYEALVDDFHTSQPKRYTLVSRAALQDYPLPKPVELFFND